MTREDVSPCHSVTVAFDLKPVGRDKFDFPALTYYPERATDRMAYITLFPVGDAMRANFMVYREMDDPWLSEMRHKPEATLFAIMPKLRKLTGEAEIVGPVKIRPADLTITRGCAQPGVVLVGDAFATSCPAAGTGTSKVFTDVERLCNVYIPRWLATEGMGADKIAAFYDDPVKRACDKHSHDKAFNLRAVSIEPGLQWRVRRLDPLPRPIGHRQDAAGACLAFGCGTGAAGRAHCRRSIDRAGLSFHAAGGAATGRSTSSSVETPLPEQRRFDSLRHSFDP